MAGFDCGSGSALVSNVQGTHRLVSAEANSSRPAEYACQHDPELLFWVGQPLRGVSGHRLELLVVEEPALADATGLGRARPSPRWVEMRPGRPTRPPLPGSSLSDAPTLQSGTYAGTVLTGEKQVFAVDLDWRQRLQAQVLIAPRTGALAGALGPSDSMDLQVFGAMRGAYDGHVPDQPTDTPTMLDDHATYRVSVATPTIRYRNRTDLELAPASVPGPQYVVISKSRVAPEKAFLVPYTLVVQVTGTAGRGAPRYVSEPAASSTPVPSASTPAPSPAPPNSPRPQDRGGRPPAAVAVLATAALMLGALVAGVALLLRRRRSP